MSFTFNKETRRSLRERIRDGINLIPGASTVVQAPANILGGGGGGGGGNTGEHHGVKGSSGAILHHQKKSHSVDSTVLQETAEEEGIIKGGSAGHLANTTIPSSMMITTVTTNVVQMPPPSSPSYLSAENSGGGGGGGGDNQHNNDGSSRSESVSSCSSSTSSSPSKYRTYVVKSNDTVTSIAASFDCTPTELLRINRLITARVLFPGQVLKIPNKRQPDPTMMNNTQSSPCNQQHPRHQSSSSDQSGPHAHQPVPLHDPATANILESITYAQRKFLKIKVRHVTDGNGVVSGTLLITPNAVMFDPNVSDPLVIEQGAETYGVIVPIEYIVGASIWSDICGMKVRGKEAFVPPGPRPVLWGAPPPPTTPPLLPPLKSGSTSGSDAGTPAIAASGEEASSTDSSVETVIVDQVDKSEENVEKQPGEKSSSNNTGETSAEPTTASGIQQATTVTENNETSNSGDTSSSADPQQQSRLESVTDHPLKESSRSSSPLPPSESNITTWYFCLTIGRPKPPDSSAAAGGGTPGEHHHQHPHKASRRNPFCVTYGQKNTVRPEFWFSVAREQVPELYKYWMFWWPHLYGEVDLKVVSDRGYELVDWDNLDVLDTGSASGSGAGGGGNGSGSGSGGTGVPRPRTSNEDGSEEQTVAQELNELTKESWEMLKQPYAKLSSFITTRGSSIMKSSSHSSQSSVSDGMVSGGPDGQSQQQQQPGHRHHHHHHHQHHHHHHNSGSTTSIFNSTHFSITNPMNSFFFDSFSNISPNHSVFDDTDDDDDEFGSFEQVVTNEELRNLLALGGDEMMAITLPDLIGGKSEILEEEDIRNITRHLTARAEGYPWTQVFTSSRDGFSLNSLYRRNSQMQEDSPVMLIVQDTNARVFGALVSCSLHTSDSFYGTGQSFLFTLRPEFNVYKWTGENLFFVKGNHDGVWIGAGDGKFGLYVDGDLNCGRTETCQTYGNAPLTEPQDFIIKTLECWGFGNYVLTGTDSTGLPVLCE